MPTVTFHTLFVFFFITHDRRRLIHLNVTAHPTADWVWRQLIAATPWGNQPRYLLRDRDRCYGATFIPRAARVGIQTVLTPVQAPKANAIAERLIGTLRRECLDHLIIVDERHLRLILMEYAAYYNAVRPHRALDLQPGSAAGDVKPLRGRTLCARGVRHRPGATEPGWPGGRERPCRRRARSFVRSQRDASTSSLHV